MVANGDGMTATVRAGGRTRGVAHSHWPRQDRAQGLEVAAGTGVVAGCAYGGRRDRVVTGVRGASSLVRWFLSSFERDSSYIQL